MVASHRESPMLLGARVSGFGNMRVLMLLGIRVSCKVETHASVFLLSALGRLDGCRMPLFSDALPSPHGSRQCAFVPERTT